MTVTFYNFSNRIWTQVYSSARSLLLQHLGRLLRSNHGALLSVLASASFPSVSMGFFRAVWDHFQIHRTLCKTHSLALRRKAEERRKQSICSEQKKSPQLSVCEAKLCNEILKSRWLEMEGRFIAWCGGDLESYYGRRRPHAPSEASWVRVLLCSSRSSKQEFFCFSFCYYFNLNEK